MGKLSLPENKYRTEDSPESKILVPAWKRNLHATGKFGPLRFRYKKVLQWREFNLEQVTKAQKGSRVIALLIL